MSEKSKVSEEFWKAIISAGSGVIDCGFCGKTHFVDSDGGGWTWEEGELEGLLEKSENTPEDYVLHSCDSISWGYLDGKTVVYGCCSERIAKYEGFIWKGRHMIAAYLKERAETLRKKAEEAERISSAANEAIE